MEVICATCHKTYTPPKELTISHCPYCGASNERIPDEEEKLLHSLSPAERIALAAGDAERARLFEGRYRTVTIKKKEQLSDTWLAFWLRLKYFALNPGRRNDRLAKDEIAAFFTVLEGFPEELAEAELYNSALMYLSTCARDVGYNTLVLGMFKNKGDDSINRIAYEVVFITRDLFSRLGLLEQYPQAFTAATHAFRDFFPDHTELLDKRL